jgi:hypothetical protein
MIPVLDGLLALAREGLSLIPDPNKRAQMGADLEKARLDYETKFMESQSEINKIEAQNPSLFVSGWRPALGWVCTMAFVWAFLAQPIFVFAFNAAGKPLTLPVIDFATMSTVLFGMLGLGTLRTVEKVQGVASK